MGGRSGAFRKARGGEASTNSSISLKEVQNLAIKYAQKKKIPEGKADFFVIPNLKYENHKVVGFKINGDIHKGHIAIYTAYEENNKKGIIVHGKGGKDNFLPETDFAYNDDYQSVFKKVYGVESKAGRKYRVKSDNNIGNIY